MTTAAPDQIHFDEVYGWERFDENMQPFQSECKDKEGRPQTDSANYGRWYWGTPKKKFLFWVGEGESLNLPQNKWRRAQINELLFEYQKTQARFGGEIKFNKK